MKENKFTEKQINRIGTVLLYFFIFGAIQIKIFGQTTPNQLKNSVGSTQIEIKLKHGDEREKQTEAQLRRLLSSYDVSKWMFTKNIVIESGTTPHSHPVLTLNTKYLKDDELLLSAFVHEQLHWFVEQNAEKSQAAFKDLKEIFPKIPIGFPEGSADEAGNYEHLIVCYWEYQADRDFFGELKARVVIDFLAHDHYTWIYQKVLDDEGKIVLVIRKNKLILPDH